MGVGKLNIVPLSERNHYLVGFKLSIRLTFCRTQILYFLSEVWWINCRDMYLSVLALSTEVA